MKEKKRKKKLEWWWSTHSVAKVKGKGIWKLNSVIVGLIKSKKLHFLSLNRNQTPCRERKRKFREIIDPMGTLQSWRRAYGAIKDTTKVGLAHVNSDYAVPIFLILFCILMNESMDEISFWFELISIIRTWMLL